MPCHSRLLEKDLWLGNFDILKGCEILHQTVFKFIVHDNVLYICLLNQLFAVYNLSECYLFIFILVKIKLNYLILYPFLVVEYIFIASKFEYSKILLLANW